MQDFGKHLLFGKIDGKFVLGGKVYVFKGWSTKLETNLKNQSF
jgi:hypothetical protein